MRYPAVYIMANGRNGTLYVGVTSDIAQRAFQHRTGAIKGFIADGLFIGQQRSKEFQDLILDMAAEADAARREFDE